MSSESSKRGKIRKLLEDSGDTLKRLKQSHPPMPSSSGAHRLDTPTSTPLQGKLAPTSPTPLLNRSAPVVHASVVPDTATLTQLANDQSAPVPPSGPGPSTMGATQPSDIPALDQTTMYPSQPPGIALPGPSSTNLPQPKVASQSGGSSSAKDSASTVLKASVNALRKSANVIPGFKPCLDILAECIGSIPAAAKNKKDYETLALSIAAAMEGLGKHLNRNGHTDEMNQVVTGVIENLDQLAKDVHQKQERTRAHGYLDSERDIDDIIHCYRGVETAFQQLQRDAMLNIWKTTDESRSLAAKHLASTRLKELNPVRVAKYNSGATSQIRRECTPGTRRLVLRELQDWATDLDSAKIRWMNGMAGTGKTTIAYSFCRSLDRARWPCASFFCSRSLPDCRDELRIMPTLAYQLAHFIPAYQESLCRVLDQDPDIGECDMTEQFKRLVRDPLMEVHGALLAGSLVVVIDALDECSNPSATSSVLEVLLRFVEELPIRFLVTCRPDPGVLQQLSLPGGVPRSLFHLHDVEASLVQADIDAYIRAELEPINIPTHQIQQLAEQSGRLFIYAATAVRYIQAKNISIDSQERVDIILGTDSRSSSKASEPMDVLYTAILSAALENTDLEPWDKENIELLLHTVVCALEPLTIDALAHLMQFKSPGHAQRAVEPLRSILDVAKSTGLVSALHASFPDYMLTKSRSGRFFCNKVGHSHLLALRCFETMKRLLRFNICNLESSFILDNDVSDLPARIEQCIPLHLRYACWYWDQHLALTGDATGLLSHLEEFLSRHALFWLEVRNLASAGTFFWDDAYEFEENHMWKERTPDIPNDLLMLYQDVKRFAREFTTHHVSGSTPHIYVSVLALWDQKAPVWKYYGTRLTRPVQVAGLGIGYRKPRLIRSLGMVWNVKPACVSISYTSRLIAYGFRSGDFGIWDFDGQKGGIIPRSGHGATVRSLAFSLDSRRIASGSDDKTIRVWDADDSTLIAGPFEGHTDSVRSVTFSPDGRYIASGSRDCTIRIWDAQTALVVGNPFQGHTRAVQSLAYSPDGNCIASGSVDHTICIWDVRSGHMLVGPLRAHTDTVRSVAYSPDGGHIASGSDDHTVRVWDSQTGDLLVDSFVGHTGQVSSVAYSLDGDQIVSRSTDATFCIWDAHTGQIVAGPFDEDSYFVMFTPSGKQIVSISIDSHTSLLDVALSTWDPGSRPARSHTPRGHTKAVASIAFSDDSSRIVSVSEGCIVCVWDSKTGHITTSPFTRYSYTPSLFEMPPPLVTFLPGSDHVALFSGDRSTVYVLDVHTWSTTAQWSPDAVGDIILKSVSFSPAGSHMAAIYHDGTTCVWDTIAGTVVAGPFRWDGYLGSFKVAYSLAGDRIICLNQSNRSFRVLDSRTGEILATPFSEDKTYKFESMDYSPDSRHFVSGSTDDNAVRVHDVQTGQVVLGPLVGHTRRVSIVAYSPNGRYIVSCSDDGMIRVWDAQTGQTTAGPFGTDHTYGNQVISVAFSPDGRLFASGSNNCVIRVWDLQTCTSDMPPSLNNWTLDLNGWVIGEDSARLLWVSEQLRAGLVLPQNTAVVHRGGSFKLDFTNAFIGTQWVECFQ